MQRLGERFHDSGRRKRVRRCLQLGPVKKVAERLVELAQLPFAQILDHAYDISGQNRLVHRGGVNERELPGIDRSESLLLIDFAGNPLVDAVAQLLFEIGHQQRTPFVQKAARVETKDLLLAYVGSLAPSAARRRDRAAT